MTDKANPFELPLFDDFSLELWTYNICDVHSLFLVLNPFQRILFEAVAYVTVKCADVRFSKHWKTFEGGKFRKRQD